jgi:hypothetical protein
MRTFSAAARALGRRARELCGLPSGLALVTKQLCLGSLRFRMVNTHGTFIVLREPTGRCSFLHWPPEMTEAR